MNEKLISKCNGDDSMEEITQREIVLQPEFVRQLRVLFDILDSDGDGFIEVEELKRYWEQDASTDGNNNNNNINNNSSSCSESGSDSENINNQSLHGVINRRGHPFQLVLDSVGEVCAGQRLISFQRFYYGVKIALSTLQGKDRKRPKLRPMSFMYAISNRTLMEECKDILPARNIGPSPGTGENDEVKLVKIRDAGEIRMASTHAVDESSASLLEKVQQLEREKSILVKELFEMKSRTSNTGPPVPPTPL